MKYILVLFFIFINIQIFAQKENNETLNEPDLIQILNKEMIQFSLERTFTKKEITQIRCAIHLKCYLDSLGIVERIEILNSDHSDLAILNGVNLQILKFNLIKYLKVTIPDKYKSPQLQEERYFIILKKNKT